MRLKWMLPVAVACLVVLTAGGCASDGGKKAPTQKEQATAQWNRARANVMYTLAKEQYATGNFDPCRKTVNDALRLDPENPPLRLLAAKLAIEGGQLDVAERELAFVRNLDPKNPEADYLSGVVQQRWQHADQALAYYTAASDKEPTEIAYLLARSEMLVALGRQEEALRLLETKVIYFENSAVIRDAVGQLLMGFRKYEEAAAMLRQASILAPDDLTVREHLALALYFSEKYNEAIEPLKKLTTNEAYIKRADLHLALGKSLVEIGRLRDARASLEASVRLDGSNAAAWLALARAAMQLGDDKRAEMSLKRAGVVDPSNSEARLLMGYLRLRQNKFQEALNNFQRASALDNKDTVSLCMVGYALQKLGRGEEAARYYAKALKMKPGDEMARKLMASVDFND